QGIAAAAFRRPRDALLEGDPTAPPAGPRSLHRPCPRPTSPVTVPPGSAPTRTHTSGHGSPPAVTTGTPVHRCTGPTEPGGHRDRVPARTGWPGRWVHTGSSGSGETGARQDGYGGHPPPGRRPAPVRARRRAPRGSEPPRG